MNNTISFFSAIRLLRWEKARKGKKGQKVFRQQFKWM